LLGKDRLARARRAADHRDRALGEPTLEQGIEISHTGLDPRQGLLHDSSSSVVPLSLARAGSVDSSAWRAGVRIWAVRLPSTVKNSTSTKRNAAANRSSGKPACD